MDNSGTKIYILNVTLRYQLNYKNFNLFFFFFVILSMMEIAANNNKSSHIIIILRQEQVLFYCRKIIIQNFCMVSVSCMDKACGLQYWQPLSLFIKSCFDFLRNCLHAIPLLLLIAIHHLLLSSYMKETWTVYVKSGLDNCGDSNLCKRGSNKSVANEAICRIFNRKAP